MFRIKTEHISERAARNFLYFIASFIPLIILKVSILFQVNLEVGIHTTQSKRNIYIINVTNFSYQQKKKTQNSKLKPKIFRKYQHTHTAQNISVFAVS